MPQGSTPATYSQSAIREWPSSSGTWAMTSASTGAVINCSNLVEVMDVETARHIAEIPLPNCRYITFDGGYAYVSSYAGAVEFDPEYRRGYVAKIDTVTMQENSTRSTAEATSPR